MEGMYNQDYGAIVYSTKQAVAKEGAQKILSAIDSYT